MKFADKIGRKLVKSRSLLFFLNFPRATQLFLHSALFFFSMYLLRPVILVNFNFNTPVVNQLLPSFQLSPKISRTINTGMADLIALIMVDANGGRLTFRVKDTVTIGEHRT